MAKQLSFAEKVAKKKKKNPSTYIKYIKSVQSEKTGYWRFNEQMIQVKEGENLDGALKRMEEEAQAIDMEMPVDESAAEVNELAGNAGDGTEAEKIEDVDAINEEQAENADGLGKVTSTKSDESA
jgi:hypothetical protein